MFKRNSWHYRFATTFGPMNPYDFDDGVDIPFCPYARAVMMGIVLFSLIALIGAVILVPNVFGIALAIDGSWLAKDANGALNVFAMANCFTIFVAVVAGLLFAWLKLKQIYRHRRWVRINAKRMAAENAEPLPAPEPSFISLWFASVHKKMCPMVKFEDREHVDPKWDF